MLKYIFVIGLLAGVAITVSWLFLGGNNVLTRTGWHSADCVRNYRLET